jgi:hypothetical protein
MAGGSGPRPSKRLVWISGLMLIAAGCANPPAMPEAPAVAPPVPAGQARIWFYRDWEPSESLNLANIAGRRARKGLYRFSTVKESNQKGC